MSHLSKSERKATEKKEQREPIKEGEEESSSVSHHTGVFEFDDEDDEDEDEEDEEEDDEEEEEEKEVKKRASASSKKKKGKSSDVDEGVDDVDYYRSYIGHGLTAEDSRALFEGYGGHQHFSGHARSIPDEAIGVVLYRKDLARKQLRQTASSTVILTYYRYAPAGKDGRASDAIKRQRGSLANQRVRVEDFSLDIDMYSQYNSHGAFGCPIGDILNALSVSESDPLGAKGRKKRKVTGAPTRDVPLAIRSVQVLRGPIRHFPIEFTAMYPLGQEEKNFHTTRGDALLDEDVVFANLTQADYDAANYGSNSNDAPRISRSVIRNRFVPVYMLPLLLAGQSGSLLNCGNSPINISNRLLMMMKQKRQYYTHHQREFDHCILQLEANIAVAVTMTERYATAGRDLLSRANMVAALFDNISERLQSYDQALYERMMTDRRVVSTIHFSAPMVASSSSATIAVGDSIFPPIQITFNKTEHLYGFFATFIELYEKKMGLATASSVTNPELKRVAFFDEYVRFMTLGQRINYVTEEIIHSFRRYMHNKHLISDDTALSYFNELEEAYAKRLCQLGIAHDAGLVGDFLTDSFTSFMKQAPLSKGSLEEEEADEEEEEEVDGEETPKPTKEKKKKTPQKKKVAEAFGGSNIHPGIQMRPVVAATSDILGGEDEEGGDEATEKKDAQPPVMASPAEFGSDEDDGFAIGGSTPSSSTKRARVEEEGDDLELMMPPKKKAKAKENEKGKEATPKKKKKKSKPKKNAEEPYPTSILASEEIGSEFVIPTASVLFDDE